MNCSDEQPHQLWEASEGMVHLFADLAVLVAARGASDCERLEELAALLPLLVRAFKCSQYRHHHLLKQRVCERLPAVVEALTPGRVAPQLMDLARITAECAEQTAYHALRGIAGEAMLVLKPHMTAEQLAEIQKTDDDAGSSLKSWIDTAEVALGEPATAA